MSNADYIRWYESRGCALVPSQRGNSKLPPRNWQSSVYSPVQLEVALERGDGIIWRMGETDLVIDVDLYKPEAQRPFAKLNEWFGGSISAVAPTVHTPRGGRHYYFRAPADVHLRGTHPLLGDAIEFKSLGDRVTCPPSSHPDVAGKYTFDYSSPVNGEIPLAPLWLIEMLTIEPPEHIPDCPHWPDDTLELALECLPVTDYGSNGEWWPILCASHYATGGLGFAPFLDWSLGDDRYAHEASLIRTRWDSLSVSSKPNYVTHLSLIKEIRRRHGNIPVELQASLDTRDFEIIANEVAPEHTVDVQLPTSPTDVMRLIVPQAPDTPKADQIIDTPSADSTDPMDSRLVDLNRKIAMLSPTSSTSEVTRCMELAASFDALQQSRFVNMISKQSGVPKPEVRKWVAQSAKQRYAAKAELSTRVQASESEESPVPADLGHYLAELVLKEHYADGEHLLYANEGRYWKYNGRYWQVRSDAAVDGDILKSTMRLRAELSAAASFTVAQLMSQGAKIVKAISASKGENFFDRLEPKPVINCQNGELWINPTTGENGFYAHSPASGLRSCLGIEYNPAAVCPWWDFALRGMFDPLPDPQAVIDHFHELLGYTIQPHKNLAAWVLLYGGGSNGKSTVLEVLGKLLGDAKMGVSLEDFDDNHIYDSVANKFAIIEDDLKKGTLLPDGLLKKLSENKDLEANPKNRDRYNFRNIATVWISSNHWPRTTDMSPGMRRRPYVFEFLRNFEADGTDNPNLRQIIVDTELCGVLNHCLSGLKRLRDRGHFVRPGSCESARQRWFDGANQITRFCQAKIEITEGTMVPLQSVYEIYRMWCDAEGIRRGYSRTGLEHELLGNGIKVETVRRAKQVIGVTIKEEW